MTDYPEHELAPAVRYYYGRNIVWGFGDKRMEEALKVFEDVARDYPDVRVRGASHDRARELVSPRR